MTCAADEELEPPWARYPWIPLGSIGWRMGSGEGYITEWGARMRRDLAEVDAAIAYLRRHPPAPRTWRAYLARWLASFAEATDDDDEGDDEGDDGDDLAPTPWEQRVDDEELTDDDAAYPVYVRNSLATDGMVAPWAGRARSPDTAFRYATRELGWWARWLATECADRAAYVDGQPPAAPEWRQIARAARTAVADPGWEVGGTEALLCTLAATGTLPPPWLAGLEPRPEIEFEDDVADDRDRWLWWATDVFDDRWSWARYLAEWPVAPPAWVTAFDAYGLPRR